MEFLKDHGFTGTIPVWLFLNFCFMGLTQVKNKLVYLLNKIDNKTFHEIHFYSEYGMIAGRIYNLFVHDNGVSEVRLNEIQSTPYHAKVKGLHVYLTLSYYCGSDELLTRYDLQEVANSMLEYYYENYVKNNRFLLKKCAERD